MKLTIDTEEKINTLIAIFHLLKSNTSCVNLEFNIDNLYIQGMDKAHVCLFDIDIKSTWFTTYENKTNNTNLAIDCNSMTAILSRAQPGNTLIIHHSEDDGENDILQIDLVFDNTKTKTKTDTDYDRFFKIPLIDLEVSLLNVPNVEYDAEFQICSKKFYDLASQLIYFGDILNIKCSEERLDLLSTGEKGEMKVNIPIDDLNEFSICEGDKLDLAYSLNYIHKMCLTTKLSQNIEVSISNEYPMRLRYNLANDSNVTLYIAPKIMD